MFDTTQYPYSLVPFRQAVSMAINRDDVSKLGEYGYAPPTDAIGLGGIFPSVGHGSGASRPRPSALATYNPDAAKKLLHRQRLHLQRQQADRPEGQPGLVPGPRHRRLVATGSPRCRSSPRTSRPSASTRPSQLEPDWNSWYPERVQHEGADAALAERVAGLAVRVLLRQPAPERPDRLGSGRDLDRQLGALLRSQRDGPPEPVEALAQAGRPARAGHQGPGRVAEDAAGDPALHRAALVDLQHEVLPLLRVAEELLRRPDLHDVPRQRRLVHADLPWRADRSVT